MPRVVIDPALPDRASLDTEIARLRVLDVGQLRAGWHTVFRGRAPPHLARHLLFRILAYRLQADRLGDLDPDTRRLLDRIGSGSLDETDRLVADLNRSRTEVRPGPLLARGGDGHLQQVMGLADGVSWDGKTYPSLSKVAFAITGPIPTASAWASSEKGTVRPSGILAIPVFERGSSHYRVCRKPAITLSRKDWHSAAN